MLGSKKSAIVVSKNTLENHVENIKKVDIDIFKSGESKVDSYEYRFKALSVGMPIELLHLDSVTGYLRLKIRIDPTQKSIISMVLDSKQMLRPQPVNNDHFEVGFKLTGESGTHYITLQAGEILRNTYGAIQYNSENKPLTKNSQNYFYKFHILRIATSQMSIVDIPQDSYRDALLNVTKLWLLSDKYDRVRHPNWAGFFDNHLRGYTMNEEGAQRVEQDLLEAIAHKIPGILITDCKATPNPIDRSWKVSLVSTDMETQISTLALSEEERSVTIDPENDNVTGVTVLRDA